MHALENLIAQQEIRDLSAKYAMFLDDHDWDAFAELWTEDAVWSIGDTVFDGREAVMDFLSGCLTEDYFAKHINGQSLIEVNEDGGHRHRQDRRAVARAEFRDPGDGPVRRHLRQGRRTLAVQAS